MPIKTDTESALHYGHTLYEIQAALSGVEWDAETPNKIAAIMREAGFHIYDSEDGMPIGPAPVAGELKFRCLWTRRDPPATKGNAPMTCDWIRKMADARHDLLAAQLILRVARRGRYHSASDLRMLEARFCKALDHAWNV